MLSFGMPPVCDVVKNIKDLDVEIMSGVLHCVFTVVDGVVETCTIGFPI